MANKLANFIKEVKQELKKVSWSTREELIASTAVVLTTVAIMAVFIGTCDLIFSRIINILIR